MKNRIDQLFEKKKKDILSVYFTAGYPNTGDTLPLLEILQKSEVDMVEIGIPFSDPLADGPVIQRSSAAALENGMTMELLFKQLEGVRRKISMPLVLMGYLNPLLRFGVERFCRSCREAGIDGVILPDLPPDVYEREYEQLFLAHGLHVIFLVTPQTSEARIRLIDTMSKGFVYLVSSASTTGSEKQLGEKQEAYFKRIAAMQLKNPALIGFGIHDQQSFRAACNHAAGAIIGSAFIRALEQEGSLEQKAGAFVTALKTKAHDHSTAE